MARRSLKPSLNQIRAWVRQGRTDAWIAHQLEVTVQQIEAFKRDNDLAPEDGDASVEEIDLRAEDDALIAAELEAAAEAEEAFDAEDDEAEGEAGAEDEAGAEGEDADDDRPARRGRRRGRRGGRGRRRGGPLDGTFDHGEEGYGLWLDPAVQDDPVYAEHWAGHRPVTVSVEEDQIVIKRVEEDD